MKQIHYFLALFAIALIGGIALITLQAPEVQQRVFIANQDNSCVWKGEIFLSHYSKDYLLSTRVKQMVNSPTFSFSSPTAEGEFVLITRSPLGDEFVFGDENFIDSVKCIEYMKVLKRLESHRAIEKLEAEKKRKNNKIVKRLNQTNCDTYD